MSVLESLAAQSRQSDRIRHELAQTYTYCSKPMEVTNQFIQAEKFARFAVQIERELTEQYPDKSEYRTAEPRAQRTTQMLLTRLEFCWELPIFTLPSI